MRHHSRGSSEEQLSQVRFDWTPARAHALSASELNGAGGAGGRVGVGWGGVGWDGGVCRGCQSLTLAALTRRILASITAL